MIARRLNNLFHPKMGEVWMLHRVVEQRSADPNQRALEVTSDWLEQKIQDYKKKGFAFIAIDSITNRSSFTNLHTPFVCVTLDDGYRDNLTVALPLFHRLQVPFCVYVTTGFIDNRQEMWWYPGQQLALSSDELRTLADHPLCTIGAHTVSHPHLDTLLKEEQQREIAESKQKLEALLSRPIDHFSYPHGAYNTDSLAICREIGFHTAVTTNGRTVRTRYAPLQLDRINIVQPE